MSETVSSGTSTSVRPGTGAVAQRFLHGRKQIFTNEKVINGGNVIRVLNKAMMIHRTNREEIRYLEDYVRGKQPILERMKQYHDEVNNRIVVNIANQIVAFKTSEFAGEPIQYVSRGGSPKDVPGKVADLNSMMLTEGKQTKDMDLAHRMFTAGVAYRLCFHDRNRNADDFDEAPFELYIPDPKNTFVVRLNDVSKRVVMGVTYVYTDEEPELGENIEFTVYTDNEVFTVKGSGMTANAVTGRVKHNFGMVPLIEYPCNTLYMSPVEVVMPLLDAINTTQSNRVDGIEQFIQAIMVFEGVDITREQLLELKDLGALKIPPTMNGQTGKVYYLNEQLDQSQTQTLVDDMYQTVLEIVGMPSQSNGNTSDSSNNGAIIMKNGWWNAEARTLETEAMWKMAETEFLKIVLKICRDTNKLDGLKVSDVEPKFGRRSYEDLQVKTQAFMNLRSAGCPPIQAFKFSKLSRDPESDSLEYEKYQEERAAKLDMAAGIADGQMTDIEGDRESAGIADEEMEIEEAEKSDNGMRTCPVCGKSFVPQSNAQKYDTAVCRRRAQEMHRS